MKKNVFSLFLLVTAVLFTSCDNEPIEGFDLTQQNTVTPGISTNNSIVGTWKLTAWNTTNALDINNDGTAGINLLTELNCYDNETLVFNTDNTSVSMSRSYADIELNLVVGTTNSYNYVVNCVQAIENTNSTWTQAGQNVAITDATSGTATNFLLSTNDNELSFLVPSGFTYTSNDGSLTVNEDLTFVYTKQ